MSVSNQGPAPRPRITGLVYLLYFLTAIWGGLLLKAIIFPGDAAATAENILAHESRYRLGYATALVSTALYVAMAALFYDLFKPASRSVSRLAAFFSLIGCAIQACGRIFQLAPMILLGSSDYLRGFSVGQLQGLALLSLKLQTQTSNIELVFFGIYDLLLGYLIFRSAFLPKALGVLMALAGAGWLTFLSPPLAAHLSPYIQVLGFLAEAGLLIWLLVKGVNVQRWKDQAYLKKTFFH